MWEVFIQGGSGGGKKLKKKENKFVRTETAECAKQAIFNRFLYLSKIKILKTLENFPKFYLMFLKILKYL